jgi:4-hydroxy-3-methylbut-2-enyl diphosphate reductase
VAVTAEGKNLPATDQATLLLLQPRGFCAGVGVDDTSESVTKPKRRFPAIQRPLAQDIRSATEDRQAAAGGSTGRRDPRRRRQEHSNRLVEVACRTGTDAYLISYAADIQPQWLDGRCHMAITAGASTPDFLVEQVVNRLKNCGSPAFGK